MVKDAAAEWLSTTGYDPVYGARPLKRLVQREIENPLALKLLEGEFSDGDRIIIDSDGDELMFRRDVALVTASS